MTATIKVDTLDAVVEMDDVFQKAKIAAELTVLSAEHAIGEVQRLQMKAGAIRDVLKAAIPETKTTSALVKYHQVLGLSDADIVGEVTRIVDFVKELNQEDLISSVKRPTVTLKKRFTPNVSASSPSMNMRF